MMKKIKEALVIIIGVLFVCPTLCVNAIEPTQQGVTEDTPAKNIINYQAIAENNKFKLYFDKDKGNISVINKENNYCWYSNPSDFLLDENTKGVEKIDLKSQVIVEYIDKTSEAITTVAKSTNSSSLFKNNTVKIEKIKNGIRVIYFFEDLDFIIPVEYTINEDGFSAEILSGKINEGKKNFLTAVKILPYFGAGNKDENGYIVIPDGSGAVTEFSNQSTLVYEKRVYGEELAQNISMKIGKNQEIKAPIFGIKKEDNAVLCVITNGDANASILAKSSNENYGYTHIYSKLNYRFLTNRKMFENDMKNKRVVNHVSRIKSTEKSFKLQYYFLSGKNANYVGMANRYSQYLSEEKGLKSDIELPEFNLNIYGAIDTKGNFLGISYTKLLPLTKFNEAETIVKSLNKKGIENISVRYIGWTNSGVDNIKIPNSSKPLNILGGEKGFNSLKKTIEDQNGKLFSEIDLTRYKKSGNGFSLSKDSIKASFGENLSYNYYSRSVYSKRIDTKQWSLLLPTLFSKAFQNIDKSFENQKIKYIGLSSISNKLYSSFSINDGIYRDKSLLEIEKLFKNAKKSGYQIIAENPNAYAFGYLSKLSQLPISSGNSDGFSYDIPFLQIALHGMKSMSSVPIIQSDNKKICLLKTVECGMELNYNAIYKDSSVLMSTAYNDLYSADYNKWVDEATIFYHKYYPFYKNIYDKKIINHERTADDVVLTEYENGDKIIVNYSNKPFLYGDNTVPKTDFLYLGGEKTDEK